MNNEEIAIKLTELDQRGRSNTKRIDAVEKKQTQMNDLVTAMTRMQDRQENMDEKLDEVKAGVDSLKEKPAQRWDKVVDTLITTAVGILIGILASGQI